MVRMVRTFLGRGRNWQRLAGAGFIILGLSLALQSLAQAAYFPASDDTQASVRPGVPDMLMFGKKLTTTKLTPHQVAAELKPGDGPVLPSRFRIPVLAIDTEVEAVGLHNSNMDVPGNIWNVGWFKNGPMPGETGNAVIAGHKDSVKGSAIFWDLGKLQVGDKIYVSDANGSELTFEVSEVQSYATNDAPLGRIFGPDQEKHLNLITCDGDFIANRYTYDKRLVVFTRLLTSN